MMQEKNVLIFFLRKLDQHPYCVKIDQEEYKIGEGEPEFTVNFKEISAGSYFLFCQAGKSNC